jgi:GH15 family glucan-1,4-alpha-glucosidase
MNARFPDEEQPEAGLNGATEKLKAKRTKKKTEPKPEYSETSEASYSAIRANLELYAKRLYKNDWSDMLNARVAAEGYAGIEDMSDAHMTAMIESIDKEVKGGN